MELRNSKETLLNPPHLPKQTSEIYTTKKYCGNIYPFYEQGDATININPVASEAIPCFHINFIHSKMKLLAHFSRTKFDYFPVSAKKIEGRNKIYGIISLSNAEMCTIMRWNGRKRLLRDVSEFLRA